MTTNACGRSARMALLDRMRATLAEAMTHRSEHRTVVHSIDGPELGWVIFERRQMMEAVNAERASRSKDPVDESEVLRVETTACGHVDYAVKFALGCVELVER